MSEYVDWPVTSERPVGLAVLLPGQNYPATMPLLTFAGKVAAQRGWQVRAVSWQAPILDIQEAITWVGSELEQAIGAFNGRVLVIAKSLGTCSAVYASQFGYDAIWLTPLLHVPTIVAAMTRNSGRQLLVGGTEDSTWDSAVARTIDGDIVQIDGADHGMFVPDAVHSAELHVDVTRAIDQWLLASP